MPQGEFTDDGGCPHMGNYWQTAALNRPIGTTRPHVYTGTYALITHDGMPGGERLSLPKLATAPKDYLKVTKPCIPKDTRYFSPAGPVAQFDTDFKHTSRTTKFERDALTYSPHYHHSKLDHVLERDAQDAHEFKGTFGDMQHCPSVAQEGESKTYTYLHARRMKPYTENDDVRLFKRTFWHPKATTGGRGKIVQETFYRKNMAGSNAKMATVKG